MLRSFGECCKIFLSRALIRRYRFRRHGPALDGAIVFAQPSAGLKLERLAAALAGVLADDEGEGGDGADGDAPPAPAVLAEDRPLRAREAALKDLRERKSRSIEFALMLPAAIKQEF